MSRVTSLGGKVTDQYGDPLPGVTASIAAQQDTRYAFSNACSQKTKRANKIPPSWV